MSALITDPMVLPDALKRSGDVRWLRRNEVVLPIGSPVTAMMFHYSAKVTVGNALTRTHSGAQDYASYAYQNIPANLNTFTIGFIIAAGTYTFRVLGSTDPFSGKIDWSVDGGPIVTGQDWYSASQIYNAIKSTTGIVLTAGAHILQGKVNGKNASSGDYFAILTAYWFE